VSRGNYIASFEKWADPRDRPLLVKIVETVRDVAMTRIRA
jgi:hypothetical protein